VAGRQGNDDEDVERLRDDVLAALEGQSAERRAADEAVASRLDDLAQQDAGPADQGAALERRLQAVPGVEVTAGGGVLRVRLTEGAFSEGTVLTSSGLQALSAVGGVLASDPARPLVVVTGHTDAAPLPPGSRFGTDQGLQLARAQAGAAALGAAGVPVDAVAMDVAPSSPPYPATDGDDPARNRTVTLAVHPRADAATEVTP
jgi:flagellar motor protein MotB